MGFAGRGETYLKMLLPVLAGVVYFTVPAVREFIQTGMYYIQQRDFNGLRSFILQFGVWAPATSILLMMLQSVVPFVPGLALTITNAWIFGWQYGAWYSWLGALAGAVLDFGLARYYGRPVVERLVGVKYVCFTEKFFLKYGMLAVLITRLTPIIPFKVVSFGAGLTRVTFWQYLFATGIGQIPAIIMYSLLGQNITGSIFLTITVTILLTAAGFILYHYRRWLVWGCQEKKRRS